MRLSCVCWLCNEGCAGRAMRGVLAVQRGVCWPCNEGIRVGLDFFEQLIDSAHTALDDMFSNTYGELYSLNSAVFRKLFKQLKEYYR